MLDPFIGLSGIFGLDDGQIIQNDSFYLQEGVGDGLDFAYITEDGLDEYAPE